MCIAKTQHNGFFSPCALSCSLLIWTCQNFSSSMYLKIYINLSYMWMYMILKIEYFYLVLVYIFLSTYFSRKINHFKWHNYTQHQKMRQSVYFDIFDNFTFFIIRKNWNTVILNEKAMVYWYQNVSKIRNYRDFV